MKGTILRANKPRGFAFIIDTTGSTRFAHANDFVPMDDFNKVVEGDTVEFKPMENGTKGNKLRAEEIRLCSK